MKSVDDVLAELKDNEILELNVIGNRFLFGLWFAYTGGFLKVKYKEKLIVKFQGDIL